MRQIANLLRGLNAPPRVRIPASPPFFHWRWAPILAALLAVPGCHIPTTTVASQPEGVPVALDGRLRGRTPLEIQARYPGIRSVEWLPAPPETPGGSPRPGRVERLELRPAPPAWLFPLDFPPDLAWSLVSSRDQRVEAALSPPAQGPEEAPTGKEIADMARRARVLALRRAE